MADIIDTITKLNPEDLRTHITVGQKLAKDIDFIFRMTPRGTKPEDVSYGFDIDIIINKFPIPQREPLHLLYKNVLEVLFVGDRAEEGLRYNPDFIDFLSRMGIPTDEIQDQNPDPLLIDILPEFDTVIYNYEISPPIREILRTAIKGDAIWAKKKSFSILEHYELSVTQMIKLLIDTAEIIKNYRTAGASATPLQTEIDAKINPGDVITALAWLYESILIKDST